MSEKVIITKSSMDAIGDAIRDRNGLLTKYLPSDMPAAIEAIPNSYAAGDEGKVVSNGALVAQTARATDITENGTYDTTENNEVTVSVSGGGGTVNWKTQSQWDAMTFAEKKQQGLTLIGTSGDISGSYYDLSDLDYPYVILENDIVQLYKGDTFDFYAFYSHTSGDKASASNRGVTWNTDDYRVICNALPVNGGYGFFCAFALTQEALAGTNTQYYSIVPVNGYNMFCAGNISGGWSNNADVTFVHNGTTKKLQSMYDLNEYTIRFDTYPSGSATFNSSYNTLLDSIYSFLSNYSQH